MPYKPIGKAAEPARAPMTVSGGTIIEAVHRGSGLHLPRPDAKDVVELLHSVGTDPDSTQYGRCWRPGCYGTLGPLVLDGHKVFGCMACGNTVATWFTSHLELESVQAIKNGTVRRPGYPCRHKYRGKRCEGHYELIESDGHVIIRCSKCREVDRTLR